MINSRTAAAQKNISTPVESTNDVVAARSFKPFVALDLASRSKAYALYESEAFANLEPGTVQALRQIHAWLFAGLFGFAGQIRSVNIAKGNFVFAPARFLPNTLALIENMPQGTFDEIVDKYVEMNVAHPFREGNGRSGRIWLDHMLRVELGRTVDWSVIPREDYLLAMERSPVRDVELKALLSDALSDRLDDAALLARSVDASYAYEGYAAYRAGEL